MSKALRLSEQWYRRGLWLIAVVFAGFLIGLGGTVVRDLPKVERTLQQSDFIDPTVLSKHKQAIEQSQQLQQSLAPKLEQAKLAQKVAQTDVRFAQEKLDNWVATRTATQQDSYNAELVQRTQAVDALKNKERAAIALIEQLSQRVLDAQQAEQQSQGALSDLDAAAYGQLQSAQRSQELRVFAYRLAITLPLLLLAVWLFVKKRQSTYWPFVWGFIFFATFTFFFELVPYLPSYGGYVRYAVGIALTAVIGRYAIVALNRYLAKQKMVEQLPEVQRRDELSYDLALARLAKKVCPGCERGVDLSNAEIDFCPHCGIGLYDACTQCNTRKSTFAKYCHACGCGAKQGQQAHTAD